MTFALLILLVGCDDSADVVPEQPAADTSATDTASDTASVDTAAPEEDCTGVPSLSWDAWADGFFTTYCQSCHASTAPDRHGAPEAVVFDSESDVDAQQDRVRARTLDLQTMPLGGGVPATDLLALDAYLRCGIGSTSGAGIPQVDDEPLEPSLDNAGLSSAIQGALATGLPQVREVREVYLGFFEYGDPICPGHDDYIDDLWLYGCWSDNGVFFSGVSEYVETSDTLTEPATRAYSVFGDLLFLDRGRAAFDGGGDIWSEVSVSSSGEAQRWTRHLGTWAYEAHPGNLAHGVSGVLDQWHTRDAIGDHLAIDGSVQFDGNSLRFDDLVLSLSGECIGKATGSLALRDSAGGWYRVDMGTTCSACGPATFEGRDDLGEICPDFSALQAQAQTELVGIIDGTLP